jgi:putative restriction endonuclease
MRVSEAWEMFGQANGAENFEQLRSQVARYHSTPFDSGDDPEIGCILISNAVFYPENAAFRAPPAFAQNIVHGKSYDLSE